MTPKSTSARLGAPRSRLARQDPAVAQLLEVEAQSVALVLADVFEPELSVVQHGAIRSRGDHKHFRSGLPAELLDLAGERYRDFAGKLSPATPCLMCSNDVGIPTGGEEYPFGRHRWWPRNPAAERPPNGLVPPRNPLSAHTAIGRCDRSQSAATSTAFSARHASGHRSRCEVHDCLDNSAASSVAIPKAP